jgi:pilus assembly protein CpaD
MPIDHIRRTGLTTIVAKAVVACTLAATLSGCDHLNDKPSHSAGWTLLEPSQRHPILVSQKGHNMSVAVTRSQHGLSSHQRAQFYAFLEKYRAQDGGNSKIVISVPAGAANEVSAMRAVADLRPMLGEHGFTETSISIEPYHAEGASQPPIRISYLRYHAEGPECGRWPDNLAESKRNTSYHNFGCAQQRNMAAMIANPADLLGPRTMSPANADRRDVVYEKYIKGEPSHANRSGEERATKQQQF